ARGRSLEEVFDIFTEATRARVESPVQRVLRDGAVVGLANHTLLRARDGRERPIADSGAPVRGDDGALTGVVLVFRDQTEELALHRALRASNQRQQSLLDTIPEIVMEVDAHKVYTWANPAGLEFFGDDVVGREASAYFEGEQNVYEQVEPLFSGEEQTFYLESWQRRRDGEKRLLGWWCRPLKDDQGTVTGALSTARDITESRQADEAVRRIAAEWQATFDASRDAIWILDRDSVIQRSNLAAERIFGRRIEELLGKHCWEIVHGSTQPHPDCPMVRASKSQQRETMELRVGERWLEVTVDPVLDESGEIARVVHVVSDITERKRTTELMALRLRLHEFAASHTLHELLVKTLDGVERLTSSQVGFYHFVQPDQQTLWLQAWSTRTARDYCQAEGAGMHYGIDKAGVWADAVRLRQAVIHNDYAALPNKKGMPEGHARLTRELVVPIFQGADVVAVLGVGNKESDYTDSDVEAVTYLAHIAWEIAERKNAEEALQESTELLSLFVQNSPIYTFIKEVTASESRVLVASENFVDLTGVPGSQMAGKTMSELFPPDFAAKISADDWAVVSRGAVLHLDEDLNDRHYTTIKFPIVRGGKRLLAGYTIDVTERRLAEQERRDLQASLAQADRLASMGMLAAGVAHEINNPLSYVLYNTETLAQDLPRVAAAARMSSAALREQVGDAAYARILGDSAELLGSDALDDAVQRARDALDGTHRIKNIARGLATFSRVERVEQSRIDIKFAIESAAAMALNEIKFRARLVQDLDEVPSVWASEGKLAQVFLNLLINAAHAIDEGHVEHNKITLRTWVEGEQVCAEVADTGAGIAPEHLARIFDPFFTTKGVGRGSGLGLAICRNIVTEFGGSISVDSEVGQGTRFVVRLPVAGDRDEVTRTEARAAQPAQGAERGRILIVDDEPVVRKILQRLLGTQHEVLCASSGREGQALLEQDQAFDVILCDLMMPEMTGMDLHAWLAEHHPTLAARIVFVTGGAFTPKAADYLARAGNLKVEKPFDTANLRKLVATLVEAAKKKG
ncbi:MAG: PAS domain-containing protein, partial [Pseudomonadota bacterium]